MVLFREIRACSKDLLLAIATPTVSFFEGQIDRYHLYFQTPLGDKKSLETIVSLETAIKEE